MSFIRGSDTNTENPGLTLVDGPSLVKGQPAADGLSQEERDLRARLSQLRQEHRDLDVSIEALIGSSNPDQLQLTRMKKRKLSLRDLITKIEDELLPDIIA